MNEGRLMQENCSEKTTMIGIRSIVGSLAAMKTAIYAAWCLLLQRIITIFMTIAQMDQTVSACSKYIRQP